MHVLAEWRLCMWVCMCVLLCVLNGSARREEAAEEEESKGNTACIMHLCVYGKRIGDVVLLYMPCFLRLIFLFQFRF